MIAVALLVAGAGILGAALLGPKTDYDFRLEATFTFDGQPYTAVGSMHCRYRRAWFTSGSSPHRLGEPIYQGYFTSTRRDAPSVVLPDGKGAILFRHGGSCPPLPILRETLAVNPAAATGATWPAYYFPDRENPKVIWLLHDRRPANLDPGRFVLEHYRFISVGEQAPELLAQNIPVAWRWYQQWSAAHRVGFISRMEDVWFGQIACLVEESEWRSRPEFVRAASGLATIAVTTLHEPGTNHSLTCPGQNMHISLAPSEDYGKATLDLDRPDLRWATILTPFVAEFRDRNTNQWVPELCVTGEGCSGIRMRAPFWIFLPTRRVFARIDEASFETFLFSHIAVRPGDGL